jgi:chemotaxis protein histidine kinase CheA
MTTPDELVAVELARLSASFVAQLREQVQAVEDEMTAWLEAPRDVERFEILSHKVHQLKGSGSTFGCPGISRAAAMTQLQIEARRARTQSRDPEASL